MVNILVAFSICKITATECEIIAELKNICIFAKNINPRNTIMKETDKKIGCDKSCIHKVTTTFANKLENAFNGLVESYKSIFEESFIPTRGEIGFTERNLTFYFCQSYKKENPKAIVWQEMPIKDENQHLDSIILDFENEKYIHVCLIESKRIYNEHYVGVEVQNDKCLIMNPQPGHGTLEKDRKRLNGIINRIVNDKNKECEIPGLSVFEDKKNKKICFHIVQLASLEYKKNNYESTFKKRKDSIDYFIKEKKFAITKVEDSINLEGKSNDYKRLYLYMLVDPQLEQ